MVLVVVFMGVIVLVLILAITVIAQPPNRWVEKFSEKKDPNKLD